MQKNSYNIEFYLALNNESYTIATDIEFESKKVSAIDINLLIKNNIVRYLELEYGIEVREEQVVLKKIELLNQQIYEPTRQCKQSQALFRW